MTRYVALLRAVNVGGTSRLPMAELRGLAEGIGLMSVRTLIASGNLVFTSSESEVRVKARIEGALAEHMGKAVPVIVRSAAEMRGVATANPFKDAPGRRVLAIFLDSPPPPDALDHARGLDGERMALGRREIYVDYCGRLLGRSKLIIPAGAKGTARNMNTVQKLADMAGAPA